MDFHQELLQSVNRSLQQENLGPQGIKKQSRQNVLKFGNQLKAEPGCFGVWGWIIFKPQESCRENYKVNEVKAQRPENTYYKSL